MLDCVHWLGADFENVHRWLDEFMQTAGPYHRKFRHHREGILEAERLFGRYADWAATIHVLRDCRNIPRMQDYADGTVDALGLQTRWPITAHIRYPEEAFLALVNNQINGPFGVLLWAFIGNEIPLLLNTHTKLTPDEIAKVLEGEWKLAVSHKNTLPPFESSDTVKQIPDGPVKGYFGQISQSPLLGQLMTQFGGLGFGYVSTQSLVAPLALIDCEYVEQLRAELSETDELSIAKFCAPEVVTVPIKAGVELPGRTVNFVSTQKTMTVGGMQVEQVPGGGAQVRYLVTNAATFVIVSRVGNRLYLRSGVHRAYLLASLGIKDIPCIIVTENQIPTLAGGYPAFSPSALAQPRPPLFSDYFDEKLSLTARLQRMNKIIRITAEEFLVPVD
jgi:hypothetical protein